MKRLSLSLAALILLTLYTPTAQATDFNEEFSQRFMAHFNMSSWKLTNLADALPEEVYHWSPDDVAMSTAEVFMHIARYNYLLPARLGVDIPEEINPDTMEEISDKDLVLYHLNKSIEHVRAHVPEILNELLNAPQEMYGQDLSGWGVLLFQITHLSEHTGQVISYARMNGITPPWSE